MQPINISPQQYQILSNIHEENEEKKRAFDPENTITQVQAQVASMKIDAKPQVSSSATSKTEGVYKTIKEEPFLSTSTTQASQREPDMITISDYCLRERPLLKDGYPVKNGQGKWAFEKFPEFNSNRLLQNSCFSLNKKTLIQFFGKLIQQCDAAQIHKVCNTLGLNVTSKEEATVNLDLTGFDFVQEAIANSEKMKELKKEFPHLNLTKDKRYLLPCKLSPIQVESLMRLSKTEDKRLQVLGADRFPLEPYGKSKEEQLKYFPDYMRSLPNPLQYQIMAFTGEKFFCDPAFFRYAQGINDKEVLGLNGPEFKKFVEEEIALAMNQAVEKKTAINFAEKIESLRKQVTELDLNRIADLSNVNFKEHLEFFDLLAVYFPNLKQLTLPQKDADAAISHLDSFKNLKRLNLSDSDVSDAGLSALPVHLNVLNLTGCKKITDKGFKVLGRLKNLEVLDLSFTDITGEELGPLPSSLKEVDLFCCSKLTDKGLCSAIKDCTALEKLIISYTNITGEELGPLPSSLKEISFMGCKKLTDKGLYSAIKDCTSLEKLDLRFTHITGEELGPFPASLKEISFCICKKLTDKGLCSAIKNCTALEKLDVCETNIKGEELGPLPSSLKEVSFAECEKLTDKGLYSAIKDCTALEKLNLTGTSIRGEELGPLPASLKEVDLSCCSTLTDKGLATAIKDCTSLEKLDVRATNITGEELGPLPASLKEIRFSGCHALTDKGLCSAIKDCRALEKLSLDETNITGEELGPLPSSLEEISFWRCWKLTDKALCSAIKDCTALEKLDLQQTNITGEELGPLPSSLKEISFSHCPLTDKGLCSAIKDCTALEEID